MYASILDEALSRVLHNKHDSSYCSFVSQSNTHQQDGFHLQQYILKKMIIQTSYVTDLMCECAETHFRQLGSVYRITSTNSVDSCV